MSATLTWYSSGLGAKTGTALANVIDDLVTLFNSKLADANFSWRVASSSNVNPWHLVLKRKDGSVGRILCYANSSAAGSWNPTLFFSAQSVNTLYTSYFPAGNTDTPLNINAASGTILGDDTGALRAFGAFQPSSFYAANYQPFYFDNAEGVLVFFQNPSVATPYGFGAGNLIVDASDVTYPCSIRAVGGTWNTFGASGNTNMWGYSATPPSSASSGGHVVANYGGANSIWFPAWAPSGPWANQPIGPLDVLTDTTTSRSWFVPCVLMHQTQKGGGFPLKLRQIAYGPASSGALSVYNTSGPVVVARQANVMTTGNAGCPWLTNFKL